jgi:hypothetical protein
MHHNNIALQSTHSIQAPCTFAPVALGVWPGRLQNHAVHDFPLHSMYIFMSDAFFLHLITGSMGSTIGREKGSGSRSHFNFSYIISFPSVLSNLVFCWFFLRFAEAQHCVSTPLKFESFTGFANKNFFCQHFKASSGSYIAASQ